MRRTPDMALVPQDKRALIAVDLGAESCRVSLLRWVAGKPAIYAGASVCECSA